MIVYDHEQEPNIIENVLNYLVGCKRSMIAVVNVVMAKSGSRVRVSASDTTMIALVQDGRNSSPTCTVSV